MSCLFSEAFVSFSFRIFSLVIVFSVFASSGFAAPNSKLSWFKLKGLQILRIVSLNNAILPEEQTQVITESAIPVTDQDVQTLQQYVLEALKGADDSGSTVMEYAPESPLGLKVPPKEVKVSQMSKIRQLIETARSRRGIMTIQRWVINGAVVGGLLFLEGGPTGQISAASAAAIGFTMGMLSGAFTFFSKGYREWAQDTRLSKSITEKVYGFFGKIPSRKALERAGDFYSNYIKWGAMSEFTIDVLWTLLVKTFSRIFDGKTWDFLLTDTGFSAFLGVQKQGTWEGGSRDWALVEQVRREADFYRGRINREGLASAYREIENQYRLKLFGTSFAAVATTSLNFLAISSAMSALKTLGVVAPEVSNRIDLVSAGSEGLQMVLNLFQNPAFTDRVINALTLAPGLQLNVTLEILMMIAGGHALQGWNNFYKIKVLERFEREFGHSPVCAMTVDPLPPPGPPKTNF